MLTYSDGCSFSTDINEKKKSCYSFMLYLSNDYRIILIVNEFKWRL